jgi:hypothetical protein
MPQHLEGLIRWTDRPEWDDPIEARFALHLAALNEYDLDEDQLIERIGESAFQSLEFFSFEDFLASDPEDGEKNPIDDYLARRGWKETASTRAYLAALRQSIPSLYEISSLVPGKSFLARDLVRGGEPVRGEEKSGSTMLHDWDLIGGRVMTVRGRTMMGGAVLLFDRQAGEQLIAELHRLLEALRADHRRLARERGVDLPEAAVEALDTIDLVLRSSAFLFSTVWLRDVLARTDPDNQPQVRTREGDPAEPVALRFAFAPRVKQAQVRAALDAVADLHPAGRSFWNWVAPDAEAASERRGDELSFETRLADGTLVLGNIEFDGRALLFFTLSRPRAERGTEMLTHALGELVLAPVEVEPSDDDIDDAELALDDSESLALMQDMLDEYYRRVLDEPVPVLGGQTPRQAAATNQGKDQVVAWLKGLENSSQRMAPQAVKHDFTWMWSELGLADRRR